MQTAQTGNRDLLDWLLANRVTRTLIALAILSFIAESVYSAGKAFFRGIVDGWTQANHDGKAQPK